MPVSLTTPEQTRTAAPSSSRIDALDWIKGALVVFMVIYHSIGYSPFRPNSYKYLGFLPPSFILIAGFLVGQVYAAKYDLQSWKPYARLAVRGLKVLGLFTVLNLLFCIGHERSLVNGFLEFGERAETVFLSGNGRVGIFEILVPIGYFLLLAPVLLWLRSRAGAIIAISAIALATTCIVLQRNGVTYNNLDLLTFGVIGMAYGLIPMQTINKVGKRWLPVLILYAAYRVGVYCCGEDYALQVVGATSTLLVLYCLATHLNLGDWLGRQVILLGKYSLLGYLVQIAILQGIVKLAHRQPQHVPGVVAVAVTGLVLTHCVVCLVELLRRKNRAVDVTYKAVFA